MKKCEWPISLDPMPSTNTDPGTRSLPRRVTTCRLPQAISRLMWASCAQSPVFHHSATEFRSRQARLALTRSGQVVEKPITACGRQRSIAWSTPGPVCRDSIAISPPLHRPRLVTIRPAACGLGMALSIRSIPCGRGRVSRYLIAANRLACECTTALGSPVVPDECVIATGSVG